MASLRFIHPSTHQYVAEHLFSGPGERFAFLLCTWHETSRGPSMAVEDAVLIDPGAVVTDRDGWRLSDEALDAVINTSAATGLALVEAHNHGVGPPRFSTIDRAGLEPFAEFILDSFADRPYAATVWAGNQICGEWFVRHPNGKTISKAIDRVVVVGTRLEIVTDKHVGEQDRDIADRQAPVFGAVGDQTLRQLRVAIVGLGGTGSHMALSLAYLGVRDFILIDADVVELSNLNRLVTATPADLGSPKIIVAKRAIRSIAPTAAVYSLSHNITEEDDQVTRAIADADLIVGCVDDDGPRLLLNRLAVAWRIPYLDVATGIIVNQGRTVAAGGRVAFTIPGGPCLACTGELDVNEVREYFMSDGERERARSYGYITGDDSRSPAVVSLNGLVVHTSINELSMWIAGIRQPAPRIDLDLLGNDNPYGPRAAPRREVTRRHDCVECRTVMAPVA